MSTGRITCQTKKEQFWHSKQIVKKIDSACGSMQLDTPTCAYAYVEKSSVTFLLKMAMRSMVMVKPGYSFSVGVIVRVTYGIMV